jgi:L-asparaginase
MPSPDHLPRHTLVIATGGTIAGRAAQATDNVGYRAAELGVQQLLDAVPALAGLPLRTLQLAQVDSKDMGPAVWQPLVQALDQALRDPAVGGVVVTHGTDTLEETAYLLQRVLAPAKPVVLTAAMRPATSLQADGPQNLLDALTVAREPGAQGVLVVLAGTGNGTLNAALESAAARAQATGLRLRLSTRCASGRVVGAAHRGFPVSAECGPAQARVELLLELLREPLA